jgi:murein DD-endopeptidase MepM/ murein hydrolase activator NlpD
MKPPLDNFNINPATQKGGLVTQFFGENPALYARFGMLGHNGIDFVQPHGSPMYAIEDAYVVDVKDDPNGFGKHVRLIARKGDEKGELNEWTYGHCDKTHVKVMQLVKAGEHIADMGNTGFVVSSSNANGFWKVNPFAGTHLHLGLRKVKRDSKGWSYNGTAFKISVLNYQNGYKGCIDPLPILKTLVEPSTALEDPNIPLMKTIIGLLQTKLNLLLKRKQSTSR